jgi:hypothetical protein
MLAKDSDKKQWPDPKDYGLPYVEITPLQPKEVASEEPTIQEVSEPPVIEQEVAPVAAATQIDPGSLKHESTEQTTQEIPQKVIVPTEAAELKKSSSWVWAVVLIGLGIVAVIIWQITVNRQRSGSDEAFEIVDIPTSGTPASTNSPSTETTVTDQNQPAANQDTISSQVNSNPNISKPAETGTTIAARASGNLIRVDSKEERPQFYIIVGSLPSEKLAIEEANGYFGRSSELYLIAPYDGGKNYRLALYKFGSFNAAAEKLGEIKSQYSEELWILKY